MLPNTLPAVTGTASAEMFNIFFGYDDGLAICQCADNPPSWSCPATTPCEAGYACCSGPLSVPGSPLPSCGQLVANPPNVSGLGLAGAFTAPAQASIGDIVVTDLLQAGTWTTLATAISATDTTVTLVDASSFPNSGFAGIENEEIHCSGKSGNQLTGVCVALTAARPARGPRGWYAGGALAVRRAARGGTRKRAGFFLPFDEAP